MKKKPSSDYIEAINKCIRQLPPADALHLLACAADIIATLTLRNPYAEKTTGSKTQRLLGFEERNTSHWSDISSVLGSANGNEGINEHYILCLIPKKLEISYQNLQRLAETSLKEEKQ